MKGTGPTSAGVRECAKIAPHDLLMELKKCKLACPYPRYHKGSKPKLVFPNSDGYLENPLNLLRRDFHAELACGRSGFTHRITLRKPSQRA